MRTQSEMIQEELIGIAVKGLAKYLKYINTL